MGLKFELIANRCQEINAALTRLDRLAQLSREEFLDSEDAQDIASYRLLVAIEGCLDLCYHISSKKLEKLPEEYAACFGNLEEAGILPSELTEKLKNMARFRNLLVHRYWDVDYALVFEFIQNDLGIIKEFITIVQALV